MTAVPDPPTAPAPVPAHRGLVAVPDRELTPDEIRGRHLERLSTPTTAADERFDRITSLACTLFGVPTAAVTLAGGHTVAVTGPERITDVIQKSWTGSFAERIAELGRPLVVGDATADPRFAGLDAVLGRPYLRFMAGVPLTDEFGVVVGTFCVYDTVPRQLDRGQLTMLSHLASWAGRELVDSTEMARAREVQNSLLPTRTRAPDGYALACLCRPTKSVGGDFYDHAMVGGALYLTLVDVMGKGVGAALVAASVRAVLRASVGHQTTLRGLGAGDESSRLADIVAATDALLADDLGLTGTIVTGFGAVLDPGTGTVDWVDAGHGLTVVVRNDGRSERLSGDDVPLGLGLGVPWTQRRTVLEPGETMLIVSDGLFDILGGTSDALDGLAELVVLDPDPQELITRIAELAGLGMPLDDVTAVALRRQPVDPLRRQPVDALRRQPVDALRRQPVDPLRRLPS